MLPRFTAALAFSACLTITTTAPAQSIPGKWTLTFSDEFEGHKLDESKWTVGHHFNAVINNERQHYVPENVILDGSGILKFKAEKRTVSEAPPKMKFAKEYASGHIESWGKFSQQYGLFEARIKMPKAHGLWPAFWLMPDRGPQSPDKDRMSTFGDGMELDIMEHLPAWGDYYHTAAIWDGYGKQRKAQAGGGDGEDRHYVPRISDEFHTYSLYWEKGRILFFADGVLVDGMQNERVASSPMEVILNCAIGGQWPESVGKIDDSALPDQMEVDWVRVYSGTISPDFYVPDLSNFPFPKGGLPHTLPAKIEAEHFNYGKRGVAWWDKDDWTQGTYRKKHKGVDVLPTHVTHGETGEWFKYTVKVPQTALYTITVQARSAKPASFSIFAGDATAPIAKLSKNFGADWSTQSVSSVRLQAGTYPLKVVLDGSEIEFDFIQLEKGGITSR